jgi:hypothetical protein
MKKKFNSWKKKLHTVESGCFVILSGVIDETCER